MRADRFVAAIRDARISVAVAESLTAGTLASELGAMPDASEWFRGAVVAYAPEVKFEVLGVTPGPVVTASCAREMAAGVRVLLGADVGLAVTGVGGPGSEEGKPAGTVFGAVVLADGQHVAEWRFPGDPVAVLAATRAAILELLVESLTDVKPVRRVRDA